MRELALIGGKYTWSNNHADPTLEKLDRVLMNDKWETIPPPVKCKENSQVYVRSQPYAARD
jgi:hypothetical protein